MKLSNTYLHFGGRLVIIVAVALFFSAMISEIKMQDKDFSLARAQKMSGKYVFLYSEPISEYDIAFEIKGFTLGNFDTPDELANFVVKNALKISNKEHKDFDGVVIGSGKVDIAIKFK